MKVIHLFRTGQSGYGLERNILCTLPGLVTGGVETVALAVTERRSGPVAEGFAAQLDAAGVHLVSVEANSRLPFELASKLSGVFDREAPDIVHSHGYKCDLAMLLARTGGARRMTTVHGWCSRNAKERFYEWINVQCCKRMDCVIVFCEDYKQRLKGRGVREEIVRVVPVGLDTGVVPRAGVDFRRRWSVPDDAVLVAQLGRLSLEKHPELFVQAACQLADRLPQARFVLVGDGALQDSLQADVERHGKTGSIFFGGYVCEMGDVLEAIDVAVNCSSTEAIPRTLLEAGAAGVPAVATAVGGVPDAVDNNVSGILCESGNVEQIAEAVARLIEDGDLRRRMGEAARERVGTVFSIETCSQNLIRTYRSLLGGKEGAE